MRDRGRARRALRRLAGWAVVLVVAGCSAAPPAPPAAELVRPEWQVGDRWIFRRTPVSGPTTFVTYEVAEVTAEGYVVRLTGLGPEALRYWTRDLALSHQTASGQPAIRFEPPAALFDWPLLPGKAWSQELHYQDGRVERRFVSHWRVAREAETIDTVAGWFVALRVEQRDEAGEPLTTYWYVPAIRGWVRLQNHVNRFVEELAEFRPGRP